MEANGVNRIEIGVIFGGDTGIFLSANVRLALDVSFFATNDDIF
jgi:hypothetical protein